MKTYQEAVEWMADAVFHDQMGGGYGQIRGGDLVGFIYGVPSDEVVYDVDAAAKLLFAKQHADYKAKYGASK
jgi:hypothetical protein